ncbi:MAG: hypothetical protein G5701_07605 [Serratia symbiotica]|nr:hypothetical protein [Serratia symbiotica]
MLISKHWDFSRKCGNIPKKSRVTILGCGGIGNHIGAALATNDIGTINLVDGDHIELSNLTRQILFDENDSKRKGSAVLTVTET